MLELFRSRKEKHWNFFGVEKFSTTYAIVSFFFSRPFMKISNFSKTVHTIFMKFCTVILHPCVLKGILFHFFRFSQKLSIRFERNFLQSFYTIYYGPLYAISSNSYGWDVRNIAIINPKMAKKQPFFDCF